MDALIFATGPVHLDEDGEQLRASLAARLTDAFGRRTEVVAARSYADVASMIARGDAHLAWLSPAVYVRTEASAGLRLLAAIERSHGRGYRGVLFVPAGSDAKTAEDLRDQRVAWVDRDSCAGHLFPRLALRERGLEPAELFREERFEGSHGSVVRAVIRGDADAGATHAQMDEDGETVMLAGWHPYAGHDGMRPLLVSAPIPPDVICAARPIEGAPIDELRMALLALHERGEELLDEVFGGPRLVAASADDYEPVRAAMR